MKLPLIITLLWPLIGCTTYSDTNHSVGWDYDFISPQGIEYRLDYGVSTFTGEELDRYVAEVSECMNLPPITEHNLMVVVVSSERILVLRNMYRSKHSSVIPNGLFFTDPNLIVLKGGTHSNEDFRVHHSMKHESTHYVLSEALGSSDSGHNNQQAQACVSGYE